MGGTGGAVGAAVTVTACRAVSAAMGAGAGAGAGAAGSGRTGRAIVGNSWYAIGGVDGGVLNGVEYCTVGRK